MGNDKMISENEPKKISTESEFYDFLDFCKENNVNGIVNKLTELGKYLVFPDMRKYIVDYFSADAENNHFDKEALQKFKNKRIDPEKLIKGAEEGLYKHIKRENSFSELYSDIDIFENAIDFVSKKALHEEKNIRIYLHAGLSAFTKDPINIVSQAPPSEGKTHVIVNALSVFPDQYVDILRDASPQSFTRDRGALALRVYRDGIKDYITETKNRFTNEKMPVWAYLQWLKDELEKKDSEYKEQSLKKALSGIEGNLVTLISLEHRVIAFLDRPKPQLWNTLLSILSHDSYYTEMKFVEGKGKLYTKYVVFKGWPAFIFATTKDESIDFHDLESRFEITEPVMKPEKYGDAIKSKLNSQLGIVKTDDSELKEMKKLTESLISYILDEKVSAIMPIEPAKIFNNLFDLEHKPIEHGDLMRKIPRLFQHMALNCLWNLNERVILTNGTETRAIISSDDLKILTELYGELEINALLSGFPVSNYEFLSKIIEPVFQENESRVSLSDIRNAFIEYVSTNKNTKLRSDKMAFSRYIKFLEDKHFIEKEKDENEKRKKWVSLIVGTETIVNSIDERIEKIGTSAKSLCEQYIGSLLNEDYRAFHKWQEIGTKSSESIRVSKIGEIASLSENQENEGSRIDSILAISGYSVILSEDVVPIFSTVRILKDFDVAWKNKDHKLHAEDVLELDTELSRILIERGIAQNVKLDGGP